MEKAPSQHAEKNLSCPLGDNQCQFLDEIVELRREVNFLKEQVRTDELTGLFNYRFFNETIALEMERTRRGTQPLSMILLDVDHFKKFNDEWGHEVGNHALVHIAQLIKIAVRKLDYPCRYGGEEFVILLPNTDLRQAVNVAERLREMIATTPLFVNEQLTIPITASLGVDQFATHNSETIEAFIQRVDKRLYDAKHNGRNQVSSPEIVAPTQKESVTLEEKEALFNALRDSSENGLE
jgi:diguanylate cyclase (GGDEF)-like protein